MMARDGVEPPTPAFSERNFQVVSTTYKASRDCLTSCKYVIRGMEDGWTKRVFEAWFWDCDHFYASTGSTGHSSRLGSFLWNPSYDSIAVDPRPYGREDKRIRVEVRHFICHAAFSMCPPNSCRIAERTRSAKSALPRELNRS